MELSKSRILTIVFTVSAVALAAYSISHPWYEVSRTGDLASSPDSSHVAGKYDYYRDYVIWTSPDGHTYLMGGTGSVGQAILVEIAIITIWAILAIVFLLSTFIGDILSNLVTGFGLVTISLLSVTYFAIVVDDRLSGFPVSGFIGHDDVWSWGPAIGWYTVLVAFALQVPAVVLGVTEFLRETKQHDEDLYSVPSEEPPN